jgi:DNA-binding transcriptional ArsR family regulator
VLRITNADLRDRILDAVGDPDSLRILSVIKTSPKSAPVIASEIGVPLSSVYRKLAVLRRAGLAFVRSFDITPEGKRQDNFISAVKELRIGTSGEEVEVELIPTEETARRIWFDMFNSGSSGGQEV